MDKEEIVKIDEKEELNVSTQRTEHLFISGSPRYLGSITLYPFKPRTIVAFNGLLTLEISRLAPDRMSAFFLWSVGAVQLGVIAKKAWSSISPRFEVRGSGLFQSRSNITNVQLL